MWRGDQGAVPPTVLDAVADGGFSDARLVSRLLVNRGITDGDAASAFLRPTLAHGLRPPALVKDMTRAASRLADAVAAGERIAVYGDYDVDGITGAAQLVLFLRALGAEPMLHVAHRAREGYGLHADVLRALRSAGARVVVTADCGTADGEELALAGGIGLDVIVCDHHHAPHTRPPAYALLNPLQPGCEFPFKGLSGAGVVFYLLMGLRAELRARGHSQLPDLRPYLDLVALGTVADVVPLREENRVLVAHGLRAIDATARPGLRALKDAALVETASVRAIGYRLAPRLNAGGRLADAREAVEMLTTPSAEEARVLAARLEVHNAERRAIEERMTAEAVATVEETGGAARRTIVVAREGWHAGVVGIVAARLAERYHRPALVLAIDGDTARGSGRSVRGVDLHAALAACSDLLDAFGGHRQAVGLSVRRDRVAVLAARFDAAIAERTGTADREPRLEIDADVPLRTLTPSLAGAIGALEPHGTGNPEPTFLVRAVEVDGVRTVGDPARAHLKLRLRQDSRTVTAIAFRARHLPLRCGDHLDAVVSPRLTRWQGVERLEVEVLDMRTARAAPDGQVGEMSTNYDIP
jgi:single-stranded-DNA-specific exonuclease